MVGSVGGDDCTDEDMDGEEEEEEETGIALLRNWEVEVIVVIVVFIFRGGLVVSLFKINLTKSYDSSDKQKIDNKIISHRTKGKEIGNEVYYLLIAMGALNY